MDSKKNDKKRDFEDIELTEEASGKKGKVYRNKHPKKATSAWRQKWKKMKKWKKAIIIIVLVLVLLLLIGYLVARGVFNSGMRNKNFNADNIYTSDMHPDSDIFNVAVFGVDTRDKDSFSGRSDTIIIVSVDKKNKTVKLTSILRDSYVAIQGYKNQKITHAYAFGGAELAMDTINRNFNMNITDYATINFYKMAEAIDVLGGIDIEITESEMEQINSEALGGTQKGAALVDHYGLVHLDGDQATIYCRLRKQDSDEARSNRQKMVINAMLTQAKKVSITDYPKVVKSIMALCETSLTFEEVMSFVPMINEDVTIEAITVPGEPENAFGGIYDGAWVWKYDLEQATNRIHMFIYGELPATLATTAPVTEKAAETQKQTNSSSSSASSSSTGTPATTKASNGNVIEIIGDEPANNADSGNSNSSSDNVSGEGEKAQQDAQSGQSDQGNDADSGSSQEQPEQNNGSSSDNADSGSNQENAPAQQDNSSSDSQDEAA